MDHISKLVSFALSCSRSEIEKSQAELETVVIRAPPVVEKLPEEILADENDEVDLGLPLTEQKKHRIAAGNESKSSESIEEFDLSTPTSTEVVTSTSMRTSAGGMMVMGMGTRVPAVAMRAPPVKRLDPGWVCKQPMAALPGCPPGLEYLTLCDTVIVQQLVDWEEIRDGYESCNRYILRNSLGQRIFCAIEASAWRHRQYQGNQRKFTMRIVDKSKREVLRVDRPRTRFGSNATIEAPVGVQIGTVNQDCACCGSDFIVHDNAHMPIFRVLRPYKSNNGNHISPILTTGGIEVGSITKMYTNLFQEMYTDADTFEVKFPLDLHPVMKANLLGACFLVDFLYFEKAATKTETAFTEDPDDYDEYGHPKYDSEGKWIDYRYENRYVYRFGYR